MVEKKNEEKMFSVYGRFILDKHGHLGEKVRKKTDDCVLELTEWNFPVEAEKRQRGFKPMA